jgi:2-polyprenyl-3-methyl-5-hydroxy-6-metoxy-1,4-benzoquinol methylase
MANNYYERVWQNVAQEARPAALAERAAFALESIATAVSGGQILDVGCGDGALAEQLERSGARVLCLDVAEEPLRRAGERGLQTLLVEPDGAWPLPDAGFDGVWAGEVIEHVLDTAAWLSEVRRVLRSGATLALSTPDHGRLQRLAGALLPTAFERRFDPLGDHVRFYTAASITALLVDFGFEQIQVRRWGGIPGARTTLLVRAVRSRF